MLPASRWHFTCRECAWADVSFHITTPLPEAPISTLDETAKARPDPKWLPLTHHWASPLKLPANRCKGLETPTE